MHGGPQLPRSWKNIHLKNILERKFKVPVWIDNDAHCFTLAESIYGAAKEYKHVVGLTLGSGIGGGLVINKKLYRGNAGCIELGHMTIEADGLLCGCGQRGSNRITRACRTS